jgi:hypothetical protein
MVHVVSYPLIVAAFELEKTRVMPRNREQLRQLWDAGLARVCHLALG